MDSRIKNVGRGTIIQDPARKAEYLVTDKFPHYVRARRLLRAGEQANVDEFRSFSLGDLVVLGLEDGKDVPKVLVEEV